MKSIFFVFSLLALISGVVSSQGQAAVIGLLVNSEGQEIKFSLETFSGQPELSIKIPVELDTGKTIYLLDRIPGSYDMSAFLVGRVPKSKSLEIIKNRVTFLIYKEGVNLVKYGWRIEGMETLEPIQIPAFLVGEVGDDNGTVRYREYRVPAIAALGEVLGRVESNQISVFVRTHCPDLNDAFEPAFCDSQLMLGKK